MRLLGELEGDRAEHAQGGVLAVAVVLIDPGRDPAAGLRLGREMLEVEQFEGQCGVPGLAFARLSSAFSRFSRRTSADSSDLCAVLAEHFGEHGLKIAPSTYYEHLRRDATVREQREEFLKVEITRVHRENFGVYGARKVWLQLNREGIAVARCTVERLMRELGLTGAVRGKVKKTTIADPEGRRAEDLVRRQFAPPAPDRLWVMDMTYVSTWSGWVYVAFVTDAYARRILGWRCGTSMTTQLVLDALEQAIWTRQRTGMHDDATLESVVAHSDRGSQYTALKYGERLAEAGIAASVGSVGDSFDDALAETINGLYKTELIKPTGPWKTVDDVEIATAEWVDWFNHRRLYEYCGDIPPGRPRGRLLRSHHPHANRPRPHINESPDTPGRFKACSAAAWDPSCTVTSAALRGCLNHPEKPL